MTGPGRVLIAGESWVTHSLHQKGFDSFTTTSYHEGVGPLREALQAGGFTVDYLPNHLAAADFPATVEALAPYAAVVLSDIGANTLLLHPDTFERSVPTPDRTVAIGEYVAAGGGLVMVGGYLTFQGIEGRARWAGTPVEAALPVTLERGDDRVEVPAGIAPTVRRPDHPIVGDLPAIWPETWSFALSDALNSGLPVVAFDIGAPGERLRALGRGHLLPLAMSQDPRRLSGSRARGCAPRATAGARAPRVGSPRRRAARRQDRCRSPASGTRACRRRDRLVPPRCRSPRRPQPDGRR